jgi:hypothetical protein
MQETDVWADNSVSGRESIHSSHFFDFYDEGFLHEVYSKLLKRELDPPGRAHYLVAIRSGESRYSILSDVARSSEARGAGVELRGMTPYHCMKVVKRIPILGRLVQAALFLWRVDALMKDLRALENHVYRVSSKIGDL